MSNPDPFELRRRAEQLAADHAPREHPPPKDVPEVLHELRVHQIELEMQNETLRASQAELEHSRDRYADLYDFAPVGYLTLDQRGTILEANLTAATLLDVPRGRMIGYPLAAYIHNKDRPRYRAFIEAARQLGHTTAEVRLAVGGPEPRWIELNAISHHPEGDNQPSTGLRTVMIDITERKRATQHVMAAKREAESANRAMNAFLSSLSHEVRTPMMAIVGYADLLDRESVSPDEQRRYLEIIRGNSHYLLSVLTNILDTGRLEAGQFHAHLGPCSPQGLVDELGRTFSLQAERKQLALNFDVAPDMPPSVITDGACLRQILSNLLTNALKFTDRGAVKLTASYCVHEDGDPRLRVEVSDTGCGIEPGRLDAIFLPFTQSDSSLAEHTAGAGLGLSIARRLARLLGGDISIRSTPGRGSTFTVVVPAPPAPKDVLGKTEPGSNADVTAATTRLEGRLLLAEDDASIRELLRHVLI